MKYARIGQILNVLLFTNKRQRYKFVPSMIALKLRNQRVSEKTVKMLNYLGICQNEEASRAIAKKMARDFDRQLLDMKTSIEVFLFSSDYISWFESKIGIHYAKPNSNDSFC